MTMNGKEKGKQIAGKATADKGKRGYDDDKTGGGRKRKNPGVIQFFEDEADDFDDSDDSEDCYFSDDSFEDEFETLSTTRNESSKGQSSLPFMPKVELVDEEEYDRMMEERFKDGSRFAHFAGDDYDDKPMEPNSFHPASREPTPTIWKVKCTVGRERLSAFCLMQKFVHLKSLGTKLQIISAFAVDHMKGFVYIEAEKQCEINEACQGIPGIYVTRVQPVPKSEVFHMFSFRSRNPEITVGMWAHVKSGNYKGDLGQVMASRGLAEMLRLAKKVDRAVVGQGSSPVLDVEPRSVNIGQANKVGEIVAPTKAAAAVETSAKGASKKRKAAPARSEPAGKKVKSKHSRSSKTDSRDKQPASNAPALDPNFFAQVQKEFADDPVATCTKVFMNLNEVHQQAMESVKERARQLINEEKKKTSAKVEELEETRTALDDARASLKTAEAKLLKAQVDRDAAFKRVTSLEADLSSVTVLQLKYEELKEVESKARQRVSELEAEVSELQNGKRKDDNQREANLEAELAEVRVELAEVKGERNKAVQMAIDLYDEGFEEALRQINLVHPNYEVNTEVVYRKHSAIDGKVFFINRETEEKTLIWARDADA